MKREDIEIMAPVGSYESLYAAIQGGANSVYFGVEGLNMRARSSVNFTLGDLRKIAEICKTHNLKTYLTVNTVIYDNEMDLLHRIIDCAKESGITAIISADIAAIAYARSIGVEVHISTQCNITNYEAVKFYSQFADVVVLARELNLKQVFYIYDRIIKERLCGPGGELVKIEMFVHGALCMAVSGKCYLSLHERNASANRGACLQVCRKKYIVKDKDSETELEIDNEYIMSPKDLCTISFLDKLICAGVRVFKIEGRARSAEYVRTVCESYNTAVDAYLSGTYDESLVNRLSDKLSMVFNRGFWNGYYLGQRLGEWTDTYGSKAIFKKVYIGKLVTYYAKVGVAEYKLESHDLSVGEKVMIIGPNTGVIELEIEEMYKDFVKVDKVSKGDIFSFKLSQKLKKADKLYKIVLSDSVQDFQN